MHENDVKLANGELISIKVNFLTLHLIKKYKIDKLTEKTARLEKKYNSLEDKTTKEALSLFDKIQDTQFETASKIIYVILRSNGKKLDFEETLALCPFDPEEIEKVIYDFKNEIMKAKKKMDMKM